MFDRHLDAEERKDRRIALLACMYANAHRDEKKQLRPFTISDFMPGRSRPFPVQGAGPTAPCPECGTPRWQGHLPDCELGRMRFSGQVADLRERHNKAMEQRLG